MKDSHGVPWPHGPVPCALCGCMAGPVGMEKPGVLMEMQSRGKEVQDVRTRQHPFCTSLKPPCGLSYVQSGTTDLGTEARLCQLMPCQNSTEILLRVQSGAELVLPFLPGDMFWKPSHILSLDTGAHTKSELSSNFDSVLPPANKYLSPLHTDSELICVPQEDDIHAGC